MSENKDVVRADLSELDHDKTIARMRDLGDEIRRFADKEDISEADERYLDKLNGEFDRLDDHRKKLERKALLNKVDVATKNPLRTLAGDNPKSTDMDRDIMDPDQVDSYRGFKNPWDLSEVRTYNRSPQSVTSELRARALTAVERMQGTTDKIRGTMADIIERWDSADGRISKMALATSDPDYVSAFAKAARGQEFAMTDRERQAVSRAMSLTDTAGGFLVPFQLDPTVIITSNGSTNPIRNIARKVVATSDIWNGVSSAAVSWSWDAEAAEVSDDATTFAQPAITIHKAAGFVPISLEALQDEQNVAGEVGRLLAFGKDTLESTAFATGSGTGRPFGIITALSGGTSEVTATTRSAFGLVDVYALDENLPARYRAMGSWLGHRQALNDVRQFTVAGGADVWERLQFDAPPLLLGSPAYEASDMTSTITTGNHYLVFGDFSHYVIADRIGTTVEFIPHLFATGNNRPSGQRGWYAYYRVGADSVADGAFRVLLL